jgi:hypothetical protein
MRVLSFVALFLSFSFFAQAQDQSEKSLVKSLKPEGVHEVVIDFSAEEINANPWDEGTFRIEMTIESNMPIQVLEQLVKVGRYTLEGYTEDGKYYVKAPNIDKHVSVRGKDLEEKISIKVKTPGYYVLNNNTLALGPDYAARSTTEKQMALMAVNNIDVSSAQLKTTLKSDVKLELKTGDIVIEGEPIEIE